MGPSGINIEYIFQLLYEVFTGTSATSSVVARTVSYVYILTYIAIVILFVVVVYYLIRIHNLKKEDGLNFKSLFKAIETPTSRNERWDSVIKHISSDNPALWRIAILEADSMLDDLLRTLGYHGAGIGEMLRQIERGDMLSLDSAWQAHKMRNKIAHEGYNFGLSEKDAQQTIALYKTVFEEFGAI